MTKYECMDCGYVFESEQDAATVHCPRCGSHPFYIKLYGVPVKRENYEERYISALKGGFPEMSAEDEEMLRLLWKGKL